MNNNEVAVAFSHRDQRAHPGAVARRGAARWALPESALLALLCICNMSIARSASAMPPGGFNGARGENAFRWAVSSTAPRFSLVDDGMGRRMAVVPEDENGRNEDLRLEFTCHHARLIAWQVIDYRGKMAPAAGQKPIPPPLDRILEIRPGTLAVGTFIVRVSVWPTADVTKPATRTDIPIRVAPRAVAFLVGINYYGGRQSPIQHAADDAEALRDKLIERGYAPESIVYVIGRNDTGTPTLITNALVKPGAPDLAVLKRPGQIWGIADARVVWAAFERFLELGQARKACHVILFFAGHATNKNEGGLSLDHILFADNESVYVHAWAQQVRDKMKAEGARGELTIIGLYDGCRNGVRSKFSGLLPTSINTEEVRYFPLFSCRPGEESNENVDSDPRYAIDYNGLRFKNGFFTFSLLTAIDQMARPQDLTVPNVLQKATAVMDALMQQAIKKAPTGTHAANRPYSQRQSLRPIKDLTANDMGLLVVYPIVRK